MPGPALPAAPQSVTPGCAAGKYGGRPSGCRDRVNTHVTADDWITRAGPPPLLFHDVGDGPAVGSLDTDTRIEPVERHLKLQCSVILNGVSSSCWTAFYRYFLDLSIYVKQA